MPVNSFSDLDYPILGNYFDVKISFSQQNYYTCSFQSINGLSKSTKTKKIQDGGDNESEYHLPNHYTYKDLTLKRGMVKQSNTKNNPSYIKFWFENLGWDKNGSRINTGTVTISVKDVKNKKAVETEVLTLYNAYPTSVTLGELNSEKAAVLIETITLGFSNYKSKRANN